MTQQQITNELIARYEDRRRDADVLRTLIAQDLNNDYMDEIMELANDDHAERESIASEIESDVIDYMEENQD